MGSNMDSDCSQDYSCLCNLGRSIVLLKNIILTHVLLAIATNIPVLVIGFVIQGHNIFRPTLYKLYIKYTLSKATYNCYICQRSHASGATRG